MSLSNKILIIVAIILTLSLGGFIAYKQIENAQKLENIQKSVVEQKQLLDNIVRAQSQYASKEDMELFAKQHNIDLAVIKKDLDALGAEIKGVGNVTVVSKPQIGNNIPSTNITPRPDPIPSDPINDPYGYKNNTQHLQLSEKFSNVEVPIGKVSFSAFHEKPWDFNITERKYSITSVLGQDDNGRFYSYAKFAIDTGGKTYDIKIDDSKFLEEYPKDKFRLDPKLYIMANGGINVSQAPLTGEVTPGIALGIFSYGKTKLKPALSILQAGVGYGVVNKTVEFSLSPIQYNIGEQLPLINNTYIGPIFQINTKGNITPGAGISVGL